MDHAGSLQRARSTDGGTGVINQTFEVLVDSGTIASTFELTVFINPVNPASIDRSDARRIRWCRNAAGNPICSAMATAL